MSNRPVLCGITTVEVNQDRYDELLRKEALLEAIIRVHGRTTTYSFHDVVGYLLKDTVNEDAEEQNS